jgi:hypothetical protein
LFSGIPTNYAKPNWLKELQVMDWIDMPPAIYYADIHILFDEKLHQYLTK